MQMQMHLWISLCRRIKLSSWIVSTEWQDGKLVCTGTVQLQLEILAVIFMDCTERIRVKHKVDVSGNHDSSELQ
jgi:hypothetical protein